MLVISIVFSTFAVMPVAAEEVNPALTYGEEVIANGDFEDCLGDIPAGWGMRDVWSGGYDPYVMYDEDNGNYIESPGAAGTISQDITLTTGEVAYLLEFDYKAEIGEQVSVNITYYSADETYENAWTKLYPAKAEWTKVSEVIYLDENSAHASSAAIFFYNRAGEGMMVHWDNITMREITNYELPPYSDSLIVNGDMEIYSDTLPTGWGGRDLWNNGYDPYVESDEERGNYIVSPGACGTISQDITLKTGEVAYLLEFEYKAEINDQASVNFQYLSESTGSWTSAWAKNYPAAADWTEVTEIIYFPEGSEAKPNSSVFFYNRAGESNVVCWDNVSFREIRNYELPAVGDNLLTETQSKFDAGHGWDVFNVWDRVTPENQPQVVTENENSYFKSTVGCGYAAIQFPGLDTESEKAAYMLEFDYQLAANTQSTVDFLYLCDVEGQGNWVSMNVSSGNLPAATEDWVHYCSIFVVNEDVGKRVGSAILRFYNQGGNFFTVDNVSVKHLRKYDTENMFMNYSFEASAGSVLTGYGFKSLGDAAANVVVTDEIANDGSKAAYQSGWGGRFWQSVSIPAGTTGSYILEYDYIQTREGHIWCNVYDAAATPVTYVDELDTVVSEDWTRARRIINLDNFQGTQLHFVFTGRATSLDGEFWMDNLSLKPVKETAVTVYEDEKTAVGTYVSETDEEVTFVFASYTTNEDGAKVLTDVEVKTLGNKEAAVFELSKASADDEFKAYLWKAGTLVPFEIAE